MEDSAKAAMVVSGSKAREIKEVLAILKIMTDGATSAREAVVKFRPKAKERWSPNQQVLRLKLVTVSRQQLK
jgi:hypothetical protein